MLVPLLLHFLLSFALGEERITGEIYVGTSLGIVHGFGVNLGNDTTEPFYGYGEVFLGIPYAVPPLGEKRFKLPQPICNYSEEIFEARNYKPRCYQTVDLMEPATDMSEDCLYLNVVSPSIIPETTHNSNNWPVMVYIHGGALTTGGADIYHWKGTIRNLVSRGVVVVTLQYRLGMLGFFTTFSEEFPPNRGIYDQLLALQWVKREISMFGGDPDRITLFGQSAGATSVSALALSPLAKGLFNQVIQTSGSLLQEFETPTDPRGSIHKERASQICGVDDATWISPNINSILTDCLLKATSDELIKYDFSTDLSWNVELDGALFPDYPENLVKTRSAYPALIGDVLEEYAFFIPEMISGDLSGVGRSTIDRELRKLWPQYDNGTYSTLVDTMINRYSPTPPADDDHLGWAQLTTSIMTGMMFDDFEQRDVQWYQDNGNNNTFFFTYAHRSLFAVPFVVDGWNPVAHCAELPFLWFYPKLWTQPGASPQDYATAENMGRIFTDFARNRNPGWEASGVDRKYMTIADTLETGSKWRDDADYVYNEQFPSILGEFPPLTIGNDSWTMLKDTAAKVLNDLATIECGCYPKTTAVPSTSTMTVTIPTTTLPSDNTITVTDNEQTTTKGSNLAFHPTILLFTIYCLRILFYR